MERKLVKAGASWVEGDKFFGRDVDLELLSERVREGTHTLLTAPRRMGKTSLVHELLRRLELSGKFATVFVDVEDAIDPPDAIASIGSECRPTRHRLSELFGAALDRVEELGVHHLRVKLRAGLDHGNWRHRGDQILEILAENNLPVVLAIDELPILVNRLVKGKNYEITPERQTEAGQFLSWLRKNAQAYQGKICLILTGSVGLEPVLSQANLSAHANAYQPYHLRPWQAAEASECLAALARQYQLNLPSEVRQDMCRRLRCCVPHHVQQFFSHLYECLRRENRATATAQDVKSVYFGDMLSVKGQVDLEHYEGRLNTFLGPAGYALALGLLTEGACANGILSTEAVKLYKSNFEDQAEGASSSFGAVLRQLQHDGYIEAVDGGYRFVSGLLEDWWRGRHCAHYIPIAETLRPDRSARR